jgi:ubiquitin-conjugating enzyme E2 D/E
MAVVKLDREMEVMRNSPIAGIDAGFHDPNDKFHWHAKIEGPPNTPYAGGLFFLDMLFTDQYPFQPPIVRFSTPIWHCNIRTNGAIDSDIFHKNWSPAITPQRLLLSIQSLLDDPYANGYIKDPVCILCKRNRPAYKCMARWFTFVYATFTKGNNGLPANCDLAELPSVKAWGGVLRKVFASLRVQSGPPRKGAIEVSAPMPEAQFKLVLSFLVPLDMLAIAEHLGYPIHG